MALRAVYDQGLALKGWFNHRAGALETWFDSQWTTATVGGITEADGNASGSAASSVASNAIWNSAHAAVGIAASVVAGVALWLTVVASAGVATV